MHWKNSKENKRKKVELNLNILHISLEKQTTKCSFPTGMRITSNKRISISQHRQEAGWKKGRSCCFINIWHISFSPWHGITNSPNNFSVAVEFEYSVFQENPKASNIRNEKKGFFSCHVRGFWDSGKFYYIIVYSLQSSGNHKSGWNTFG